MEEVPLAYLLSPESGTIVSAVTTEAPRQRLASLLLKRPVTEFIAERRSEEPPAPYRRIAAELRDATSGELDVSDVTVRAWWLATPEGQREQADRKSAKEADATRTAA
jgi:hypothetical protein